MSGANDEYILRKQYEAEADMERANMVGTPIDIGRTEIPKWAGFEDASPVVWVATQLVSVVGSGNVTVINRVVGVSRDRKTLEKLAAKDHTVSIELVEMVG